MAMLTTSFFEGRTSNMYHLAKRPSRSTSRLVLPPPPDSTFVGTLAAHSSKLIRDFKAYLRPILSYSQIVAECW